MWKLLEQAAKTATANASEYASTVQAKAQTLVATVQDEAATLLHAIGSARIGPVDELLYEEMDDYKVFCDSFKIDKHTDEISKILEDDDEIRGLHEQMVPVQISYEEFWSRYFFRYEQEQLRQQEEAERKRKKQEQEEAKAAAKRVLDEFEVDDDGDDDEEFLAPPLSLPRLSSKLSSADDERGDLDDAKEHLQEAEGEGGEGEDGAAAAAAVSLTQLREARAHRKAALQWKQKALEYQKQLHLLSESHDKDTKTLKESMESQYQRLCDSYETKMAEVTMQIDDARAVGYNEGIQESEAIIATMQQQAEQDMAKVRATATTTSGGDGSAAGESLVELDRLMDALTLKEQVVVALEEQKTQLESALADKDVALQLALAAAASNGGGADGDGEASLAAVKRDLELWKVRAIKMKKAKEQVDAELQALKDQSNGSIGGDETGTMEQQRQLASEADTRAAALAKQLEEMTMHAKKEFERGVATAQAQAEKELQQLRDQVAREERYHGEISVLQAELAVLREQAAATASVPPSSGGGVLAQADAVLSGLGSPSAVAGSELLDATWTADDAVEGAGNAAAAAAAGAAPVAGANPPDWGEW